MMRNLYTRYQAITANKTFIFPLVLLVLVVLVNYSLQENMFTPRVLNANLRSFTPLIFLAVAQTIVIISGSIDLSIGVIMSLVAAVLVTRLSDDATAGRFVTVVLMGLGVGLLAGAANGVLASFVRLPAFVTTYAMSWVFSGIALIILPRPGGSMPTEIARGYRFSTPLNIPIGIYLIGIVLLLWWLLRSTRFGTYLYAIGGNMRSAYATGVPVTWHRFITHMLAGGIAAFAALFFTLNTGSSDARIGGSLTLDSIVAVVLGGTAMSGGVGGIIGSILGVLALGFVRNIVSFSNVDSWNQPLVDSAIILLALAAPGTINLIRNRLIKKSL